VRALLLGEMCARALKHTLRRYSRSLNDRCADTGMALSLQSVVASHVFNLLSGASAKTEEFWQQQLVPQLLLAYGPRYVRCEESSQ
jgi:hypothetical protein